MYQLSRHPKEIWQERVNIFSLHWQLIKKQSAFTITPVNILGENIYWCHLCVEQL